MKITTLAGINDTIRVRRIKMLELHKQVSCYLREGAGDFTSGKTDRETGATSCNRCMRA